jgi:quercetin dioxygenase-like cupin family protein
MSRGEDLDPERLVADSAYFERRVIDLAPDQTLALDRSSWRDALVFVTDGEIECVCASGQRRRFGRGAILCMTPTLRALGAGGDAPVRLIAVSRTHSG